jgi:membrane associated rhomboid family serine protease
MPRPSDPKLERWKYWGILALVFMVGGVCAAPFGIAIFRLLDTYGYWLQLDPFRMALRAALATTFAGVMLCILLLFYRLRNDDNSPSLTSGLLVVALGVVLTALVVFAMRGQYKQSSVIRDTRNAPYAVDVGDDHATCLNAYEALT